MPGPGGPVSMVRTPSVAWDAPNANVHMTEDVNQITTCGSQVGNDLPLVGSLVGPDLL